MKDSNDLDVEMNSLKGKLVTTGTTLTTTTTMSGYRSRRPSRMPLNTIGPSISFYLNSISILSIKFKVKSGEDLDKVGFFKILGKICVKLVFGR